MRNAVALVVTSWFMGCVPTHASFLHVPVVVQRQRPAGPVIVRLPIAELKERMDDFDLERIALYHRGRTPIPHRSIDTDDDAVPDTIIAKLPAGAGHRWIAITCPSRVLNSDPLPKGGSAVGVKVDFRRSQR